ncbi:MAG TPA: acetoacetate--CoA ligase [Gemmatimonadales bacterium]|nr:acetoacetate--CoA ligase [Gemmatimonadales bacterium]
MSHTPLWTPSEADRARAELTRFRARVSERHPEAGDLSQYAALHRWSVEHREAFWAELWRFAGVIADERPGREPWDEVLVGRDRMQPPAPGLGPRWFTGARLNFAENLLRRDDGAEALVSWDERGRRRALSFGELRHEVARIAAALRQSGVVAGDRVAGFVPNGPEAIIAMLAAASLGAIWSSCSPDFGAKGVLDRFGQIRPKVLFACDGYRYAGKRIDLRDRVREVAESLPDLVAVVGFPWLEERPDWSAVPKAVTWEAFAARGAGEPLRFERLPFDHPLYILYSSGTTGLPKCIVHSAGGTLLQHLKELVLHTDLRRDDRIFYFTTCGWMMWNWLVSGLAVGATVVLYDGAALPEETDILWRLCGEERLAIFGTSAKYLALAEKEGVRPARYDLRALRAILSTGSPLAPASYDWVYAAVKPDLRLSSISGGTDIVSCFALGDPTGPVYRGELQCLGLGMAVEVWDAEGRPVVGEQGELVCTKPFPSMPVAFWDDADGAKYRGAYFDFWPDVWRHGDWAEVTERGGLVIYGRSDATLNPGGVRIGTAEIYRQVELEEEVVESLVVGQTWGDDVRIVLFVRLRPGLELTEALADRIRKRIRGNCSPHHVPKKILQVADIPRTLSGKIVELAVREVIHGRPVRNQDALANPQALELFRDLEALKS